MCGGRCEVEEVCEGVVEGGTNAETIGEDAEKEEGGWR